MRRPSRTIRFLAIVIALSASTPILASAQGPITPAASADSSAAASNDAIGGDLAPSTAPAWVPRRPAPSEMPWETALHLPGRLATLPLSALGQATRRGLVFVEESSVVPQVIALIALHRQFGLFLGTANLGERTGLGGAARLSPPALRDHLLLEMSASTSQYNRARVDVGAGPARLAYAYEWRSRDQFFGLGHVAATEDSEATYATRIQRVEASLGWTWGRHHDPRTEVRAWIGPRDLVHRDGRDPGNPGLAERFPALAATVLDSHVEHLTYGASLSHDRRAGAPHWSHGFRLAGSVERFDRAVEALAIRSASTRARQFTRFTVDAEGGVSFMRDPRTLRLRVRAVDQAPQGSGILPLGDLARLGGGEGLSGFEPGRFHDTDLIVGKLSYVFPLAKHFEFDLHVEAGNVYDRLRDVRFDRLEHSYGLALRPRLETAPMGSIGVDWSDESFRIRYAVGGVQ